MLQVCCCQYSTAEKLSMEAWAWSSSHSSQARILRSAEFADLRQPLRRILMGVSGSSSTLPTTRCSSPSQRSPLPWILHCRSSTHSHNVTHWTKPISPKSLKRVLMMHPPPKKIINISGLSQYSMACPKLLLHKPRLLVCFEATSFERKSQKHSAKCSGL